MRKFAILFGCTILLMSCSAKQDLKLQYTEEIVRAASNMTDKEYYDQYDKKIDRILDNKQDALAIGSIYIKRYYPESVKMDLDIYDMGDQWMVYAIPKITSDMEERGISGISGGGYFVVLDKIDGSVHSMNVGE